jgi:hypothetical protein
MPKSTATTKYLRIGQIAELTLRQGDSRHRIALPYSR